MKPILIYLALVAGMAPALYAQQLASSATKPVRLTDPQDDYPDVAPDNRHIIFQSNRSGKWQLWLMDRETKEPVRVAATDGNDRQPAWSPDGQWIVFSSDAGLAEGKRAIMLMPSPLSGATGAPRRLTDGTANDIHPKWLRDGSGVVFNRLDAAGKQADVHILKLDGAMTRLPLGAGLNTYASIDPRGRTLAFRGTADEAGTDGPIENSDIYSARSDGSARRRLTTDAAFDGWPAISPDGTTIAFASRRGGDHFRLYLMPIEGGEQRLVATPAGYHYTQPAWSRDGRSLVVYRWIQDASGEVGHLVWIDLPPEVIAS